MNTHPAPPSAHRLDGDELQIAEDAYYKVRSCCAAHIRASMPALIATIRAAGQSGAGVVAYRVRYRDGVEELTWPNKDGTRDDNSDEWHGEPVQVTPLAPASPDPVRASGFRAVTLEDAQAAMLRYRNSGDVETDQEAWLVALQSIGAVVPDAAREES